MRPIHLLALVLALHGLASMRPASAQENRRGVLKTPGLVIETAAPTAPCNALTFTPDGKWLLAAGGRKVVRAWPWDGGRLVPEKAIALRWATWREQRGVHRRLALSPDADSRNVAVGGFGLITGTIAVLDRQTRQVVHALTDPGSSDVVTSIGFAPSGAAARLRHFLGFRPDLEPGRQEERPGRARPGRGSRRESGSGWPRSSATNRWSA